MTTVNKLTNEQIKEQYQITVVRCARLQALYMDAVQYLGKEDEATQTLWKTYVEADAEAQPFCVKMGQIAMQEQIDNMSASEFETFRRNND